MIRSFGEIVHERRTAKGFTLEGLARKIGSHKGYVSGIENRKVRPPSPKITKLLCKALGLNFTDMVTRSWLEKRPKSVCLSDIVVLIAKEARDDERENQSFGPTARRAPEVGHLGSIGYLK